MIFVTTLRNKYIISLYINKYQVSFVLSSLTQGGRGTQACINAQNDVSNIINELDTQMLFMQSGAALGDEADRNFPEHKFVFI